MKKAIKIYLIGLRNAFAERMAYRGDFFISMTIMLILEFIVPLVTYLIYRSGMAFPGWSLYEMLLLQGIFMLAKGIAFPLFFGIVWNVLERVREGTFDLLIIKPGSILFMTIITGIDIEDFGKLLGGFLLFGIGCSHIQHISIIQWLQFILLLILSVLVLFSFSLFMAGSVFKWVGNSRVYELFNSVMSFATYPRSIFSKGLQTIISWVIPIAMVAYFPASALLTKSSEGILYAALSAAVFFILSLLFWKYMLRQYTSAGG